MRTLAMNSAGSSGLIMMSIPFVRLILTVVFTEVANLAPHETKAIGVSFKERLY